MYDHSTMGEILLKASTNGSKYSLEISNKNNDLFQAFGFMGTYIDDLFILTKVDWKYHVQNLNLLWINWERVDLNVVLKYISSDKTK